MDPGAHQQAQDLKSRTRALLRRLGKAPGSPEEAREHLKRRVALYFAIAGCLWIGTWVFDRVVCHFLNGNFWQHAHEAPHARLRHDVGHVAVGLLLLGARGVVPRLSLSAFWLTVLEIAATAGQVLFLAWMMSTGSPDLRPDLSLLLGTSHVLVLRAAIVPSRPQHTLVLGIAGALLGVVFTALLFRTHASDSAPAYPVVGTMLWGGVSVVSTAAISRVIYGLREDVRAAIELGQYTLLEKLGEGGMGVVYKARHALLRRPTAVKVLPPENTGDTALARFEREVQLTAQIAHPNIVSVYDFGRSPDGAFYYAMEYLDGIDLQRLVDDDGPQPPSRVVGILTQIADALAEAHEVGLVHRDIKPANVIVCAHRRRVDRVKVVDFGLVKELGNRSNVTVTDSRVVTGTPLYLSPEAITTPNDMDARSDLYALGAVGYFLLTGTPVFGGRTVVEVCAAHLHKEVEPPSRRAGMAIPPRLEALLLRCLEKAPDDRPASAAEVIAELAACGVRTWNEDEARAWWETREARGSSPKASGVQETLTVAPRSAAG